MVDILPILIATSTVMSLFCYWAFAKGQWLPPAYWISVGNGFILAYINWLLSQGQGTWAVNIFSVLCVGMVASGLRGIGRLRAERKSPPEPSEKG